MSLIVSNRATDKQIETLRKLEYYGSFDLTMAQAADLIDELFEQQRMDRIENDKWWIDEEKTI
jgi:hypothetical protein